MSRVIKSKAGKRRRNLNPSSPILQLIEKDRAETKIPQVPAKPFPQDFQNPLSVCAGLSISDVAATEPSPEPRALKAAGAQALRFQDCTHHAAVSCSDASASVENILLPNYLFFV